MLTEWARGHVDVCCLKFHREYKSVIGSYGVGELHSDQAYQDSYTLICSLDLDENLSEEALDEKNAEYLETFPRRPSAALVQLIHDAAERRRSCPCGRESVKQPSAECAAMTTFGMIFVRLRAS